MKHGDWTAAHLEKVETVFDKLKDKSVSDTIDYFQYDNMAKNESDFCALYRTFTKCHVSNKLNCLLCACPHFKYSDDEPLLISGENKVMSICLINSKKAKEFTVNGVTHCDCSDCMIPHSDKYIKQQSELNEIHDSCSLLEMIRSYQLGDTFGKYKLF